MIVKDLIVEKMYDLTKKPYSKYFKTNQRWNISLNQFLSFPEESLGFHVGCFLLKYNFDVQPKLEDHDVIHVLTNTGISVVDEIGMQYYLFGNGKRSPYLFMVIATGTLLYPTKMKLFLNEYKRGKTAHQFHDLEFVKILSQPIGKIRETFRIN